MNILIWILIYLVCISICAFSCIATDTKSIFLNIFIGSLILFTIIYYSNKLISSDLIRLLVVTLTLLFNSVFYNNYQLSTKCILLFIDSVWNFGVHKGVLWLFICHFTFCYLWVNRSVWLLCGCYTWTVDKKGKYQESSF